MVHEQVLKMSYFLNFHLRAGNIFSGRYFVIFNNFPLNEKVSDIINLENKITQLLINKGKISRYLTFMCSRKDKL